MGTNPANLLNAHLSQLQTHNTTTPALKYGRDFFNTKTNLIMKAQEIQKAQQAGKAYASDNYNHIYQDAMTAEEFAKAALENHDQNAIEFDSEQVRKEHETDFMFGAKQAFKA